MSLVFKLTIPDGTLAEYLSTMSSKARNFEIIRLATNDLLRMQQPQSNYVEELSNEGGENEQNESKQSEPAYASSYIGISNDTNSLQENDDLHKTENEAESSSSNRVDFGAELLDMN